MNTETEEKNKGLGSFDEENMFNSESFINDNQSEEEVDLTDFDGVEIEDNSSQNQPAEENENQEESEDNDDSLSFEETEENKEIDIESFNKQFGTKFQKAEELKEFLAKKEEAKEIDEDEKIFEQAQNQLDFLVPIVNLDDEGLMRKQFETMAVNDKKDLNDENVQIEINEKIEDLKDSRTLSLEARDLRRTLQDIIKQAEDSQKEISQKREAKALAEEKEFKSNLQKEFGNLYSMDNFYGVNLDKKTVQEVYQKVASGDFIKSISSDKKVLAELALMSAVKKEIFKKSSGLTYNDGMKAVLDEYKSKKQQSPAVVAQKRGTSANNEDTQKGLIDSILYTKPKEEAKTE